MQLGSKVNVRNYQQQTPLHLAALSGHQQVAEVLIQHGSDLKAGDAFQQTALHLAAVNGHKNIVETLIQQGSNVNGRNYRQQSALHLAAQNGHQQITELLIQHGSDVKARDYFQKTALHLAAQNGHHNIAQVLIQHGSDVSIGTPTPLYLAAAQNGHREMTEFLIQQCERDADVRNTILKSLTPSSNTECPCREDTRTRSKEGQGLTRNCSTTSNTMCDLCVKVIQSFFWVSYERVSASLTYIIALDRWREWKKLELVLE